MANNYENDAIASWTFEAATLYEDVVGSNDLTLTSTANHTIAADASDKKQGATSWSGQKIFAVTSDDFRIVMSRADGSLSSDFPLKEGGSENALSVCFWFKMDYTLGNNAFRGTTLETRVGWGDATSILLGDTKLQLVISKATTTDNGTISLVATDDGDTDTTLLYDFNNRWQMGTWYHVGFTYNADTGAARIRVHDSTTTLESDKTSSSMPTSLLSVPAGGFFVRNLGTPGGGNDIGAFTQFWYDDLVVFRRILDPTEIDDIWTGDFGPEPPGDLDPFPPDRPSGYDPDPRWQPGEWNGGFTPPRWDTPYVATGGGRWGRQLIGIGRDQIYYEELT
jgi:hypothetical protein